ncbi:MAG: Ku protein [Gaiellales bacterium]
MRPIWKGSLSFGLVTIPVGLAVAQQRQDISFRTIHRECGTPIRQKRYCPTDDREVDPDELIKGWEFAKGQYVPVEDSDLEAVAVQGSRSIELVRFVRQAEVDPIYYDRAYYLSPAADPVGQRPYGLFLRALQQTGMAAVGKFVLWGKENLALVRALDDALVLETLYYAGDVRPRSEISTVVEQIEVGDAELEMARQLVESLAGPFDADDYENEHRVALKAMLEAKLKGETILVPEPTAVEPVTDVMAALKQSLAAATARAAPPTETKKRRRASTRGGASKSRS